MSLLLSAPPVSPPRIRSVPPYGASAGDEAIELAASCGIVLDPWQQMALRDGLGERDDGKWAAFEVAVNGSRQNGKNEIALARQLAGLFLFDERLLIHSAHEFKTSTEHQRRFEEVVQDTPHLHKRVKPRGYKHSHGEESIELRSGQRIRFMTRTKGGGRGHTGDCVTFDEAMILPLAMIGALMPTMSARSILGNPQLWYFFTAVDQLINEHGVVAAKLRARALAGGDPSLAYFEWSAGVQLPNGREATPDEVPDEVLDDRRLWAQANPAMGIRIAEEYIANERRSMDARTFAVERLGIGDYPAADGSVSSVISKEAWAALQVERGSVCYPLCLSFDVPPDRSATSIGAAWERADGAAHVEVVEHQVGTGSAVERLVELAVKHKPAGIVVDGAGPAASLVNDLEKALQEAGVVLEWVDGDGQKQRLVRIVSAKEHAQAAGGLFDRVEQATVRHLGQQELTSAVRGATKRPLGDSWAWSRKTSVDISPLVAVTLAGWGSERLVAAPEASEPVFAWA